MSPEFSQGAFALAVAILFVVVVAVMTIRSLMVIVPPNRAAVLTGRERKLISGERIGYRSVIGGRTLRVPIIETVQHISLETFPVEISVANAFSKGNIPLNIEAIAAVKIASQPETVFNNAVERLLGKTEEEIWALAKDTLMGNLRGVLATLTPEEVNEDRLGFAKALAEDAGEDLAALGFHLDVLKIQNVGDERGYLEAIGRKRAAEAVRDAEIAEADATAETRQRQANARQVAEIKEADAAVQIAEAQNKLRVRKAELDREAQIVERTAQVKAQEAEVEAQKALESRRVEREKLRLQADVVAPANAELDAAKARAEGDAAPIREKGRATAQVLQMLYDQVKAGGEQAYAVFLAEKLPDLLATSVGAVRGVDIDKVVVIDSGGGTGVSNAVNQRVQGALGTVEAISSAVGVDISSVLQGAVAKLAPPPQEQEQEQEKEKEEE
ncbi:MAG: flotillin family protein [Gemmatimonadetes bacterium]|nr:flotillin family protein [Gemmatimonadota bacterium]